MNCLLAFLLALGPAAPSASKPLIALLPMRGLGVPADVQHALQETLRNEVSALPEVALIPADALGAALRAEPDCEATLACAAAAAARSGATAFIMGTASQLGDAFLIDLKLVDAHSGRELRRATHPVSGSRDGLIETLRASAVELLAPARYVGTLRVEVAGAPGAEVFVDGRPVGKGPSPAPVEELAPGQHTVRVAGARDQSSFVEVRFGRLTIVRIDASPPELPAERPAPKAPLLAVAGSAAGPSQRASWVQPAGYAGLGLGLVAAIIGVSFQARASATASDLNRREARNALGQSDLGSYGRVNTDVKRARGFLVGASALGLLGGGLLAFSF